MICEENMTCEQVKEKMTDYLDGDVEGSLCNEIKTHIDNCPDCFHFFSSFRKSIEVCRENLHDEIPDDVKTRLRECLDREMQQ